MAPTLIVPSARFLSSPTPSLLLKAGPSAVLFPSAVPSFSRSQILVSSRGRPCSKPCSSHFHSPFCSQALQSCSLESMPPPPHLSAAAWSRFPSSGFPRPAAAFTPRWYVHQLPASFCQTSSHNPRQCSFCSSTSTAASSATHA